MLSPTDDIAAKGIKPWCAGFESGDATWLAGHRLAREDAVLRLAGPDVYDQWVNHDIPFNDSAIETSLDDVGKIPGDGQYVNGGFGDVNSIATTAFQDGGLPVVGDCAASCRMAETAQWPGGTDVSQGGDVFVLPPDDERRVRSSRSGGGEFVTAF